MDMLSAQLTTADEVNIDDQFRLGDRIFRVTETNKVLGKKIIAATPVGEPMFDGDDVVLILPPDSALKIYRFRK